MGARSLIKPTGSILNSCYEISKQTVSVNGALWLVKSGVWAAPRAAIAALLLGFLPQFHIQSSIFSDDTPSSYRHRRGKAHRAFVQAAFVAWRATSPWLSIRRNHFADKRGV